METKGLPAVTIFNACATVRQNMCVPERPKVNLPPVICYTKPQLRLKFVIFEAGKDCARTLLVLLPPHELQWDRILAPCRATLVLNIWHIKIARVLYL